MRVLFIVPDLVEELSAQQALLLVRGLEARGHQVRVASTNSCSVGKSTCLANQLEALRGFEPDIVHTFQPWGNLLGRLLAGLLTKAPVIVSAHIPADDRSPLRRWCRGRFLGRTAFWIAPTAGLADRWRSLGIPRAKIRVIAPGIEAPSSHPAPLASAATLQLACLGPFHRRKGGREAIWALDILTHAEVPAHLHLVGAGPELGRLHTFARALRTEERVTFHLHAQRAQVFEQTAQLVWVPSLGDDEPLAVLLAMAHGRAVVASAVAGLADVLKDGQTGLLVPPGDKPALARQSLRLVENPTLRQEIGLAAAERVRLHFQPERFVDAHLEVYRTAVQGR